MMYQIKAAFAFLMLGSLAQGQPVISETGQASSVVRVSVIIPAKAKIIRQRQIEPLTITTADVRRGCKLVHSAADLTVWSSSPDGYLLKSRVVAVRQANGPDAAGIIVLAKVAHQPELRPLVSYFQDLHRGGKAENNLSVLPIDLKLLIGRGTKPGPYIIEADFDVAAQ